MCVDRPHSCLRADFRFTITSFPQINKRIFSNGLFIPVLRLLAMSLLMIQCNMLQHHWRHDVYISCLIILTCIVIVFGFVRLGSAHIISQVAMEYETMPGWSEDISKAKKFEDLPPSCQKYVLRLEELIGVPIRWIGVGPGRSEMIDRQAKA